MKRNAFTLIEMMIAIVIFSLIVVFLYRSYGALKQSNEKYATITKRMERMWRLKKMLYLDFALSLKSDVSVLNQERNEDVVILQSANSIHNRFNPYIAYVMRDGWLYRLESLRKLQYPFGADVGGDVDKVAQVKRFRVYKAMKKENQNAVSYYLVDIKLENGESILYKIRSLNEH